MKGIKFMNNNRVIFKVFPEHRVIKAEISDCEFDAIYEFNRKFLAHSTSSLALSTFYCTDEKFKSYFPNFITESERKQYTAEQIKRFKNEMRDTLCRIASNGYVGREFIELRKIYFENFA